METPDDTLFPTKKDSIQPIPKEVSLPPTIPVENVDQTQAITKPFEESLKKMDAAKGTKLTQVFRDCMKIHNSNAMLRANMQQIQIVLQEQLNQWSMIREQLGPAMKDMKPGSKKYTETMKGYLELCDKTTKLALDAAKAIKDIKKEIRLTEMGDQYHYHVSTILTFMSGVTALLFKELQTSPQLDSIMKGMNNLAKMFRIQEHE